MSVTRERWRYRLPHWEVAERPHFTTFRSAHSLPRVACAQIAEIHAALGIIKPASPQFAVLQRKYFSLSEKYLDQGVGFTPFLDPAVCQIVRDGWSWLANEGGWQVPHYVIMLNHVHFLLAPDNDSPLPLRVALRNFKGRTGRLANAALGRTGPFWQADSFDCWMRDEAETARVIEYIRQNPVKAGLVRQWQDYQWVG